MIDIDRALSNNYLDDLRGDVTSMRALIPPVSLFTGRGNGGGGGVSRC